MSKGITALTHMLVTAVAAVYRRAAGAGDFIANRLLDTFVTTDPTSATFLPNGKSLSIFDENSVPFIIDKGTLANHNGNLKLFVGHIVNVARANRTFSLQIPQLMGKLLAEKKLSHFFGILRTMNCPPM